MVIKNEDFTILKSTYPEHPLTKEPRRHLNRGDMLNKRKQQNITELDNHKKAWDVRFPSHVERKPRIQPEDYIENPNYSSIAVRKSMERRNSRLNVGLTENFVDIKDSSKDPGLGFVSNPEIASMS